MDKYTSLCSLMGVNKIPRTQYPNVNSPLKDCFQIRNKCSMRHQIGGPILFIVKSKINIAPLAKRSTYG